MKGLRSTSGLLRLTAIALLGLLFALVMFVLTTNIAGGQAKAMSTTDWQTVAGAIDSYVSSQYVSTDDGEAGFLTSATALKGQMDSNNNGAVLGEGDDAATAPVLLDTYTAGTNWIPGTNLRVNWAQAASAANAAAIASKVDNHRRAGFNTDIVLYCATGHTESPPTMALGAMASAGYFGSPAPRTLALKWGRLGWGSAATPAIAAPTYTNSGNTSTAAAGSAAHALPAGGSCTAGGSTTAELVRCAADAGLTGMTAGVDTPWAAGSESTYQPVDLRSALTGGTVGLQSVNGSPYAIQDPMGTLFNSTSGTYSNLAKLDPAKTVVFFSRTQHTSGMVAAGARMLGYNASFMRWGLPRWNGNTPPGWTEKWPGSNPGYAYTTTLDTTAPTISGAGSGTPGTTAATIAWTTGEPATSKVEYGTVSGSYPQVKNDTILHAAHSVNITGLTPGTTYYYRVTSYDGSANGTSTAEMTFTTATVDNTPPVVSNVQPSGSISTTSATISADYSDSGTGVNQSTVTVKLDGASLSGCTVGAAHVDCAVTGLALGAHTIGGSVADNAGNSAAISGGFTVTAQPPADTTAPTISNVQPTGTITTSSTTISADYSDSGSGINQASVVVQLDGAALSGCTVGAAHVDCPLIGLTNGTHTIGGAVSDNVGNSAAISGSFTVNATTAPPAPAEPPVNQTFDVARYGLENDMLFIANGRASNVAVVDVAQMSMVDYIPVPRSPINTAAAAGQLGATLDKAMQGTGYATPVHLPDMFYWEVHGVVPSADRSSVYAIGALAVTDSDFTMYQVDTKTHNNTRKIPMAPSVVGYCGLEYDRNNESSGVLYAESMQTGPADLAQLTGLPLQLKDPIDRLLPTLGLGGLVNSVENSLSLGVGGISEENLATGTNTRFIATDYNANGASSTCGIAWDASGSRAFASQMFEPLIDTINWNTKTVDGEIIPPTPYRATTQHQSTSAKTRDLLITANGSDGVAIYSMALNTMVGRIDINRMVGQTVFVHGVEIAPNNENIVYVLGDGAPTGMYVLDITDIRAPKLLGGLESGFDTNACGTYAINDKQNYYRAAGKCEKPALSMTKVGAYWESYAAYQSRELTVNFNMGVSGTTDARNVNITDVMNTGGVTTTTPMPLYVGDLSNTKSATVTIKYNVSQGVSSFRTAPSATAESPCGDTFTYPGYGAVGVPQAPRG